MGDVDPSCSEPRKTLLDFLPAEGLTGRGVVTHVGFGIGWRKDVLHEGSPKSAHAPGLIEKGKVQIAKCKMQNEKRKAMESNVKLFLLYFSLYSLHFTFCTLHFSFAFARKPCSLLQGGMARRPRRSSESEGG
jgi:hypothetical protein